MTENDCRFVIFNSGVNIKEMLNEKGYPFKSKEHSCKLSMFQKKGKEINDLVDKIEQYKQLILKCNCKYLNVDAYSLEQYLDIDSWTYGMNYKDELLSLGFTKQDMDEFIANKYEQYLKEKEENTLKKELMN